MDWRDVHEAGFIARFIHILLLGVIIALGVHFGSRTLIAALTMAWFVIFSVVYLLVGRQKHQGRRS